MLRFQNAFELYLSLSEIDVLIIVTKDVLIVVHLPLTFPVVAKCVHIKLNVI